MSRDPYHEVQQEVQTQLQNAITLRSSYLRIRSTAREGSEELGWARNECKATVAALEADLEDLEESVRVVEETGGRLFGIDDKEVIERRKYVEHVKTEIGKIRRDIDPRVPRTSSGRGQLDDRTVSPPEIDDQSEWSRMDQQMMVHQQETTLHSISGTLTTLAEQGRLMGQEIGEQTEFSPFFQRIALTRTCSSCLYFLRMLGHLESQVDSTESKLSGAMKKLRKFIRDTEETKSGWCIVILIIVLCILLAAVILF